MAHGDLLVERRKASRKGCGGVALHEHQLRWVGLKILPQTLQGCTGDVRQGLARGHQVEIPVRRELEQVHHLGHHFSVLTGQHHPGAHS